MLQWWGWMNSGEGQGVKPWMLLCALILQAEIRNWSGIQAKHSLLCPVSTLLALGSALLSCAVVRVGAVWY